MSNTEALTADEAARNRIRNSLDESMVVEAAAGTGKTSELVRRVTAVLRSGRTTVDRIVAVTFTRKAASELRLRLRIELDAARSSATDTEEIRALEHALSRLEEAQIGTIHAFCAEILRQRPVEARIAPGFEELDEDQAGRLYARAFDTWVQRTLKDPPPGVRRVLSRTAAKPGSDEVSALYQLRSAGMKLVEWRDFPAIWRRDAFDRMAAVDAIVAAVAEFASIASDCNIPSHPVRRHLQCVVDFESRRQRAEESRPRDYDRLEGMLVRLARDLRRTTNKGSKKYSSLHSRDEILSLLQQFVSQLDTFEKAASADLAASLQDELRSLVENYETIKNRAGKLDFVDLLIRTRDLLRDHSGVRSFLQNRFTHIFVDEFQDTDPVQAEILILLAAADPTITDWRAARPAAGKLFLVGDPKQSIYRFRRADIIFYQDVCRTLQGHGAGLVYLSRSFRAVKGIQDAVNTAFAPEMTGDLLTGQPAYVPLDAPENQISSPAPVSLIALPVPYPYGVRDVTNTAILKSLPDTVAAFIYWLLHDSGWHVRDPERADAPQTVPIASRHIAVLFRRFMSWGEDVTRDYVRALESRDIPHLLWGARSFHEREEVETVRAALNAIEWPDDELSVYAVLKGSLFAIPDGLLLRYRHDIGRLHPFHLPEARTALEFKSIADALALFADLHRQRNRRSAVESIHILLNAARAHAAFALRPAGNQVLMNVYRIADLARRYEFGGGISFRGFVEHLNAQAEREDRRESPVLEEAADGVRIMTVHEAKGLEFPVVIAADMTARIAQDHPDKFVNPALKLGALQIAGCAPWDLLDHASEEHKRDEAEGVRIAYVAATRARDVLVIPAIGDGPRSGWLQSLNKAIYPPKNSIPQVLGIPVTGNTTVLRRPIDYDGDADRSVKPGIHKIEDTYEVAWWDPATLDLDVPPRYGLHLEEILSPDDLGHAERGVELYGKWQTARASRIAAGSVPALSIFTATDAEEPPAGYASRVQIAKVTRKTREAKGPRFGTLVHMLFRDTALGASRDAIETLAHMHQRLLAATDDELDAAVTAVFTAFAHPLLKKAQESNRVYRELPIVSRAPRTADGKTTLAEGAIDLAFLADDAWVIVDFKTDVDTATRRDRYRRQVAWYVYAMEKATGQRAVGWLLHV